MDFVCLFSIAGISFLCHGFCKASKVHIAKDSDVEGWLVFHLKERNDAPSDILLRFIGCLIQKQEQRSKTVFPEFYFYPIEISDGHLFKRTIFWMSNWIS